MRIPDLREILGIALFGTLILIVTNGLTFSGITVFDEALLDQFQWSKSTLKFLDFVMLGWGGGG